MQALGMRVTSVPGGIAMFGLGGMLACVGPPSDREEAWGEREGVPNTASVACGIRYEVSGRGTPVVLIHGGGLDSRMWKDQVALLSVGHLVVTYDVRGFGGSEMGSDPFSHEDDLACVLDALDIESASLVGLSLGGAVALNLALSQPLRVDRLLLAAPAVSGASTGTEDPDRSRWIGELAGAGRTVKAVDEWLGGPHMSRAMANVRPPE